MNAETQRRRDRTQGVPAPFVSYTDAREYAPFVILMEVTTEESGSQVARLSDAARYGMQILQSLPPSE